MIHPRGITNEKKEQIAKLLQTNSIRETSRVANVSFFTAWCVFHGKYNQEKLQERREEIVENFYSTNTCPITGWDYK